MRIALAFAALLTLAACDSAPTPYDDGVVEGTYTLPDGTTGAFRTRATANAVYYSGLGTGDGFVFGTAFDGSPDPDAIGVSIEFEQGTLAPVAGRYSARFDDPERPNISASFTLQNVPGLDARDSINPSWASVSFPDGTVDVEVVGRLLRGTFNLRGNPSGVADSVEVRVVGRFETPFEPGTSRL